MTVTEPPTGSPVGGSSRLGSGRDLNIGPHRGVEAEGVRGRFSHLTKGGGGKSECGVFCAHLRETQDVWHFGQPPSKFFLEGFSHALFGYCPSSLGEVMRIAVSGTIGVGKSTLCGQLSEALGYEVFDEPVADNPYLDDFYADPHRWAFDAQVFMISHRFRRQMEAVHAAEGKGSLLDRCFHEDRVFAEVNHEMGHISDRDWSTYLHLYESFCRVVPPPEVVVYLRTSPEVAVQRIRQRGRESEQGISMEYMRRLHHAYDRWFQRMKTKTNTLLFPWDDYTNPGVGGVLSEIPSHLMTS